MGDVVRFGVSMEDHLLKQFHELIRRKGHAREQSFTVRKISYGVGVERIFPVFSPMLDRVEVVSRGKVRRARLYYLRQLSGKKARIEGEETFQIKTPRGSVGNTVPEGSKPA